MASKTLAVTPFLEALLKNQPWVVVIFGYCRVVGY
jgi:hypothetical protein